VSRLLPVRALLWRSSSRWSRKAPIVSALRSSQVRRDRRSVGALLRELQQQSHGVAVGRDRVRAGLALLGESVGEERLESRADQTHGVTTSVTNGSSRFAAAARSSGAADRYQ